jgi:hypothetical protein
MLFGCILFGLYLVTATCCIISVIRDGEDMSRDDITGPIVCSIFWPFVLLFLCILLPYVWASNNRNTILGWLAILNTASIVALVMCLKFTGVLMTVAIIAGLVGMVICWGYILVVELRLE